MIIIYDSLKQKQDIVKILRITIEKGEMPNK